MEENKEVVELRCPKCNSRQIRTTKRNRVCNHCGYVENLT